MFDLLKILSTLRTRDSGSRLTPEFHSSGWRMVDMRDETVGMGVGKTLEVNASRCVMTMVNDETGISVEVSGIGAGASAGLGVPFPVSISTDKFGGVDFPGGMMGEFICGPAAGDFMRSSVFHGFAPLIGLEGHVVLGGGVSLLMFTDRPPSSDRGNPVINVLSSLVSVRLFGLVYGSDLTNSLGVNASALVYTTTVKRIQLHDLKFVLPRDDPRRRRFVIDRHARRGNRLVLQPPG